MTIIILSEIWADTGLLIWGSHTFESPHTICMGLITPPYIFLWEGPGRARQNLLRAPCTFRNYYGRPYIWAADGRSESMMVKIFAEISTPKPFSGLVVSEGLLGVA